MSFPVNEVVAGMGLSVPIGGGNGSLEELWQ